MLRKHGGVALLLAVLDATPDTRVHEHAAGLLAHVAATGPRLAVKMAARGGAVGLVRVLPALLRASKSRGSADDRAVPAAVAALADLAPHDAKNMAEAARAASVLLPLLAYAGECHAQKALAAALRVLAATAALPANAAVLSAGGAVALALRAVANHCLPATPAVLDPALAFLDNLVWCVLSMLCRGV